jgi:hypothetical protein
MMAKQGHLVPMASDNLVCTCGGSTTIGGETVKLAEPIDPRTVKDQSDGFLWDLIKEECPNYFNQQGIPNGVANRLFDLFRADLLGLIADYAVTPISDVYIELDTGDVLAQQTYEEQHGDTPHVFLEVDILERALTQRAVLRATAAKILRQLGFSVILRDMGDLRLTDIERDELLRMVYSPKKVGEVVFDPGSSWYGYLTIVKEQVVAFLTAIKNTGKSVEEREQEQLARASTAAREVFTKLETGKQQIINQFTEPEVDVQLDPHAEILEKILKDPIRQELFLMWVDAEKRSNNDNPSEYDRLNMSKLYSILTPVFTDVNFPLDEARCSEYQQQAENLGFYTLMGVRQVEEEYHAGDKKIDFLTS